MVNGNKGDPMPNLDPKLSEFKRHLAVHDDVFYGLRVSVDAAASPTAIYDRSRKEYALIISGRSGPGAILYGPIAPDVSIGSGVVLRFPDWVRPAHVQEMLYGAGACGQEVALMHFLLMQLDRFEINDPDATAIYDALNAPSKEIMDTIFSMRPVEAH
jgi:hypothetical protein